MAEACLDLITDFNIQLMIKYIASSEFLRDQSTCSTEARPIQSLGCANGTSEADSFEAALDADAEQYHSRFRSVLSMHPQLSGFQSRGKCVFKDGIDKMWAAGGAAGMQFSMSESRIRGNPMIM